METPVLSVLVLVGLGLLVAVTGGIGYLTLAEWRDRRRLNQEKQQQRRTSRR
ncbi:MAG: hypothetical protein KME35_13750 [Aphanocapsa sp. GSE-SYN-MK-11-07L]|nr:hypothetical protein [Aphanocapsa sp. GSE-SYN-MK-11-07L]